MSGEGLFDREKSALGRFLLLVRTRAAREKKLAAEFQAVVDAGEKEAQKARKQIAATRKRKSDEADERHQERIAAIAARYDTAQATADQDRWDRRKETVDRHAIELEGIRGKQAHVLWVCSSVQDDNEADARKWSNEMAHKARESSKVVETQWVRAEQTLALIGFDRTDYIVSKADLAAIPVSDDPPANLETAFQDLETVLARLEGGTLNAMFFSRGVLIVLAAAALIGAGAGFSTFPFPTSLWVALGEAIFGGLGLVSVLRYVAGNQIRDRGIPVAVALAHTEQCIIELSEWVKEEYGRKMAAIAKKADEVRASIEENYAREIAAKQAEMQEHLDTIERNFETATRARSVARQAETTEEIDRYTVESDAIAAEADAELAVVQDRLNDRATEANAVRFGLDFESLAEDWFGGLAHVVAEWDDLTAHGEVRFPPWESLLDPDHPLPTDAPEGIRFGEFAIDLSALPDGVPGEARLVPPEPIERPLPAYLPFPSRATVLLKAQNDGRAAAVSALQAMMLRFLTGLPPGKVRFTILDPVGLGENFGSFMHLADFDEKLITSRIWTEAGHIEKRLGDLTTHIETVIQKYLRNEFDSIEQYNRAAGEVAEPYRVLVVANFPHNFTPEAAKRLVSIMASGPACGVCTLVSLDQSAKIPREVNPADLDTAELILEWRAGRFRPVDADLGVFPLELDTPPDRATTARIVKRVGEASLSATQVRVPFEFIAPERDAIWTASAADGFDVPIGRAGVTRRQRYRVGHGTAQHALIAGKTGSGKSTLIHALITNLALTYSPDEAELYLIDFKKGVEFQAYARFQLPHARVVAIESEREFGVSILQRLDAAIRGRGEEFRKVGVNDLEGYRTARPGVICPRTLLVIDEFQEFFVEDDKLAQEAALLLDRLVRQGRAFGVHVLLGSQTIGGAYSLARSTIDQMAIRIALQCSDADAQLIFSKDNSAARLLTRPGEAIYNDANGMVEGNSLFQVAWLPEELREQHLIAIRERSAGTYPPPMIFEGAAHSDITKCYPLRQLLADSSVAMGPPAVWLGDPIAIKDPVRFLFRLEAGANLLFLGQNEESSLALLTASLVALAARFRPTLDGPRIVTILDSTPEDGADHGLLRTVAESLGFPPAIVSRPEIPAALGELAAEVDRRVREETTDRSPRFLLVQGIQRIRELRKAEDDYGFGKREKAAGPAELLARIAREGPAVGVHVIAWCDTLHNLHRAMDRDLVREFPDRVLFQMSGSDSSHLVDSPLASRLGPARALFVEQGGERPEKFRPYAVPSPDWLRTVGARLRNPLPAPETSNLPAWMEKLTATPAE